MCRSCLFIAAVLGAIVAIFAPATTAQGQCAFDWRPGEGICGTDGKVWATTVWDPDGPGPQQPLLVAGGSFGITGNIFASHIAAWNGTSWQALGSGTNGSAVKAVAVYNGELIAAGDFTLAGGVAANGIARWNGTSWQPLNTGISGGSVKTLIVYGSELIAGGDFTSAGGMLVNCIARWNGATWLALGTGIEGTSFPAVNALTAYGGELIVGGSFTGAGGMSTYSMARWNGSSWQPFPMGPNDNGSVAALTVYNSELIAGGDFTFIGGLQTNGIARWNGSTWQAIIPNGQTLFTTVLGVYSNELIVGGGFSQVDGVPANNIARWDGASWQALGAGLNSDINSLTVYNGELIAGGAFTVSGPVAVNRIARWNGAAWQALNLGIDNLVNALGVYGGELIAGGGFINIGNVIQAHGIARWNGSTWQNLGAGMNHLVNAVSVYGSELIAGGSFTTAGGTSVGRIARWNGTSWNELSNGVLYPSNPSQAAVNSLAVYDGELVAGGSFSGAGGEPSAGGVAAWNGTSWRRLDSGTGVPVRALVVYNNELIAGGGFTQGGLDYIAHWNGTNWQSLGGGVIGSAATVNALCVFRGELIAGGVFDRAGAGGETNFGNIARWNGLSWQTMGSGMNNAVRALAVYNGELFAGGDFTIAGGIAANRIARWDGSTWNSLTSGTSNWVAALGGYNNELIMGGAFNIAGGNISGAWARWGATGAFVDCNTNGILDACDIDSANSLDCNSDGVPDDCQQVGTVNSRWIPTTSPHNWSVAANWCQPLVPNNGAPPGNTYNVTILGSSPTCTLDINPTISALTIEQNGVLEVNAGSGAAVRTLVVEPPTPTISNAGTIRAKDAKRFLLDAADINQTATGVIEAIGQPDQVSKVQINGRRVVGGTARTSGNAAVIELLGGAVLDSVTIEGNVVSTAATVNVPSGQTGVVAQMINNEGLITVAQPNSVAATFLSPADVGASFSGTGCVSMLNRFARLGEFKGFIVNGAGHCVEGAGRIFGTLTNESGATVTANHPTHVLTLSAPGSKTSDGLFQAVGGGKLSIEDDITGTGAFVASGGTIDIPGVAVITVTGSALDVLDGGQATLNGSARVNTTGRVRLSCSAMLRGCNPPVLNVTANAGMNIGGNMLFDGPVDVLVGSTTAINLAGNFNNQSGSRTTFRWESGLLTLNGSVPQSFEMAGQDFGGPNPVGFIDNFAMGTLRVEPGRTVNFNNDFDNIPGAGCEVLYVDTLSLGAGSTINLNGCNVYYRTLIQEPGAIVNPNGGLLLSALIGDMNCDSGIGGGDIQAFLTALIDPAGYATSYPGCNINHGDFSQSGGVDINDLPGFVNYLLSGS